MNTSKSIFTAFAIASVTACAGTGNGRYVGNAPNAVGSGGSGDTVGGTAGDAQGPQSNTGPRGKAYVGLFGENAVAVVDVAASGVVAKIPVSAPDGLVVTPDGGKVYVSSNNTNVVDVIDTATDAVKATVQVGTQPAGLSITNDGKYVVVSVQGDGLAAVIDTASDAVIASTSVGKAHNSGISSDGTLAFVASQVANAPALDVVGLPSAAARASFSLDAAPRAVSTTAGKLYATLAGSADVAVLDATTGRMETRIPTAGSPHDIRPTVDGAFLLTVSQTAGDLEVLDPATSSVTAAVKTGTMPHWIGLSSDGDFAFVTNEGDDNLVVVDLASHNVAKTIAVGKAPRKIAVQSR